jgi:protein SCO1
LRSLLLVTVIVGIALYGCGHKQSQPPLIPLSHTIAEDITGADYARDFDLLDAQGRHRRLRDFQGKVVAVFFGYTHCPDVCPTTLYDFSVALKILGGQADNKVQVLFVTVDPERDTPAVLAQYVPAFNPHFIGLYSDPATTARTAREFKVYYRKQAPDPAGRYSIDHSAFAYVYDTAGRLRLRVPYAESSIDIAKDLGQLLR